MSNETLAVPSDYNWDAPELVFADGKRIVPEHLAAMMTGLDTTRLTYDQAVELANRNLEAGHLGRVQQGVIRKHFEARDGRRS